MIVPRLKKYLHSTCKLQAAHIPWKIQNQMGPDRCCTWFANPFHLAFDQYKSKNVNQIIFKVLGLYNCYRIDVTLILILLKDYLIKLPDSRPRPCFWIGRNTYTTHHHGTSSTRLASFSHIIGALLHQERKVVAWLANCSIWWRLSSGSTLCAANLC